MAPANCAVVKTGAPSLREPMNSNRPVRHAEHTRLILWRIIQETRPGETSAGLFLIVGCLVTGCRSVVIYDFLHYGPIRSGHRKVDCPFPLSAVEPAIRHYRKEACVRPTIHCDRPVNHAKQCALTHPFRGEAYLPSEKRYDLNSCIGTIAVTAN